MHVKNHMPMWSLWFLWFLHVEYSGNPLYKPLCAFLVFVDLLWFLCGSFCGFWSRVVFWLWSARPIVLMWFCGSVVLPSMPMPMPMPSVARTLVDGLALDADAVGCASSCRCALWLCGFVALWICGSVVLPVLMRVLLLYVDC